MSLHRIKKLQRSIDMNESLFPKMPDFGNWTEEQLDNYNRDKLNEFHKQDHITNYNEAESYLQLEFNTGLLSKDELEILLIGEKDFWENNP